MPTKAAIQYAAHKAKVHKHLGGRCAHCGISYSLQVDHKDCNKKNCEPMGMMHAPWAIVLKELELCQLLCVPCHKAKTKNEGSAARGRSKRAYWKHGSITGYKTYKCRCELCKKAKSAYDKDRRRQQRSNIRGVTGIELFGFDDDPSVD